jgi:probable rRNA maturation factor
MIDIFISDPYIESVQPQMLENAVQFVLAHQGLPSESEMTVLVEDDDRVHELNLQFLGIDASTDVLSFPSDEIDPETGNRYLGDIIISYPKALTQSQQAGHAVESELQLLVVHGCLHLLGYDHAEEGEKRKMWAVQSEILEELGVVLTRFSDEQ